jgi:hypothetical protein
MPLHYSTFQYIKPTDEQMLTMAKARDETAKYADFLEENLESGPDKTYIMRKLREVAMWVNICITRDSNGKPWEE